MRKIVAHAAAWNGPIDDAFAVCHVVGKHGVASGSCFDNCSHRSGPRFLGLVILLNHDE